MSIIARVMNGNEPVHGVEVGIFAGEECRGAATEEFISGNDTDGYWFLSVAGDETTPLTIRVYDPATNETTTINRTLSYTDDAILGSLAEPYIIQLNAAQGIEEVGSQKSTVESVRKVLINDHLYFVYPNGEMYDVTGKKVSAL